MVEWTLLNLGQISRNRYWGEADDRVYRPGICNGVVLRDKKQNILVDPPFSNEKMLQVLDARAGLKPQDIHTVFITHGHVDHFEGLSFFPKARWVCYAPDHERIAALLEKRGLDGGRLEKVSESLTESIWVAPLPGHTRGSAGLLFPSWEGRVLVAGDAVMTRDFYCDRHGYYISEDQPQSARTIDWIALNADVVIPGHDNYFLTAATKFNREK